jgi:uncharacterized OsmC-like protein
MTTMTRDLESDGMRNGVDVPTLFATIDAVKAQPAAAAFKFRVKNRWISGTNSMGTISGFYGVGGEQERDRSFVVEADHPTVLVGNDNGPTPAEYLLAALAACLTAGIGNIAAARGVELTEVESTVEGDIDLNGILGLSDEVRNGFNDIRVNFKIRGNAPEEKLRAIVKQSEARSAVFDMLTNGTSVTVTADAATS